MRSRSSAAVEFESCAPPARSAPACRGRGGRGGGAAAGESGALSGCRAQAAAQGRPDGGPDRAQGAAEAAAAALHPRGAVSRVQTSLPRPGAKAARARPPSALRRPRAQPRERTAPEHAVQGAQSHCRTRGDPEVSLLQQVPHTRPHALHRHRQGTADRRSECRTSRIASAPSHPRFPCNVRTAR